MQEWTVHRCKYNEFDQWHCVCMYAVVFMCVMPIHCGQMLVEWCCRIFECVMARLVPTRTSRTHLGTHLCTWYCCTFRMHHVLPVSKTSDCPYKSFRFLARGSNVSSRPQNDTLCQQVGRMSEKEAYDLLKLHGASEAHVNLKGKTPVLKPPNKNCVVMWLLMRIPLPHT